MKNNDELLGTGVGVEALATVMSIANSAPSSVDSPGTESLSTGEASKNDRVCTHGKQARPNTAVFVLFVVKHGGTRGAGKRGYTQVLIQERVAVLLHGASPVPCHI